MNEWIKTWRGGEFLILRSDMKTCILKQPSHLFLKFIYYSFENVSPQNHSVVSWWSAEESRTASLQSLYYRSSSLFVCVDEPKTDEKRRAGGKTEQWSCQSAAKRTVWIQDAASRHQSEAPVLFPQPSRSDDQLHQLWRVIIYLQCRMRQRQESRAVTGLCYFVHTVV